MNSKWRRVALKVSGIGGLCVFFAAGSAASAPAEYGLKIDLSVGRAVISKAGIGIARPYDWAALPAANGAVGRTRQRLSKASIDHLPAFAETVDRMVVQSEESGFDLWDAAEQLHASPNSALIVTFDVESDRETRVILGFGCSGDALIALNGKLVFGTETAVSPKKHNDEEYIRTQSLVPLSLRAGINKVSVLCRKCSAWDKIPDPHASDQWMLGAELYTDDGIAWQACRVRNFDLLDTPIVKAFADLRVTTSIYGRRGVLLYDLAGKERAKGEIDDDGRVLWDSRLPELPFHGFLEVDRHYTDAIFVTGEAKIEDICQYIYSTNFSDNRTDAWAKRCAHLLKPVFIDMRDNWWARKLVLSTTMAVADLKSSAVRDQLSHYRPSQIEFAQFRSDIDGTNQYYRVYRGAGSGTQRRPVLMVLPTVEDVMRPPLEGQDVANIRDAEDLATLGDEFGIDIVWPGNSEVDFGGNLSLKEIAECVDDFKKRTGNDQPHIYAFGVCSSGVTAIACGETMDLAGVILEIPVINRSIHRFVKGLDIDEFIYPSEALASEQTASKLHLLANRPVYIVFNTDMPGHGRIQESRDLVGYLLDKGGSVEAHYPKPEHFFLWGERNRVYEAQMCDWISRQEKMFKPPARRNSELLQKREPQSVKDALLLGFKVNPSEDQCLTRWIQGWKMLWESYRGAPWEYRENAPTVVETHVLKQADYLELEEQKFFSGRATLDTLDQKAVSKTDELWGFRLIPSSGTERVDVFRSENASVDLPKCDLVIDGCCKAVLWRKVKGQWQLLDVWL